MSKTDIGWEISDELRTKYPSQSAFIDRILPNVIKIYEEIGFKYFGDTSDRSKYAKAWITEHVEESDLEWWRTNHPELIVKGTTDEGKIKIGIIANFAKYDTYDSAFEGYKSILLNTHFVHALRNTSDPVKYVQDIQSELPGESHPRYAQNDGYTTLMTNVMKMWKMID